MNSTSHATPSVWERDSMNVIEQVAPGLTRTWALERVLYKTTSPFQDILIAVSSQGISLFCNSERQSTEAAQLAYHEAQVLPAVLLADKIDSVLVIGSTEGVASEIAVSAGAKNVIHVDIDEQCLFACSEFLPYGYTKDQLRNAREKIGPVHVVVQDGLEYVKSALQSGLKFDVIVVDLPDEDVHCRGQQCRLYDADFLRMLSDLLSPGGAVISQAGNCCLWRQETLIRSWVRANAIFPCVVYFGSDEHDWSWIVARNDSCDDAVRRMREKLATLPYQPQYIDEASLVRSTITPKSLRDSIKRGQNVRQR